MASPVNRTAVTAADNTYLPAHPPLHSSAFATTELCVDKIAASAQRFDDNVLPRISSPSTIRTTSIADMPARVDFPPTIEPNNSQDTSGLEVSGQADLQSDIEPNMTSAMAKAASSASDSTAMGSQNMSAASRADCLFLDKLPAELRNLIYEMAFTSDDNSADVELCDAQPPNNALLSTCQQIRSEASQLYDALLHEYWTQTHFIVKAHEAWADRRLSVELLTGGLCSGRSQKFFNRRLDLIRHIQVISAGIDEDTWDKYVYMHDIGIWHWYMQVGDDWLHRGYVWFQPEETSNRLEFAPRWCYSMEESGALAWAQVKVNRCPFHEELQAAARDL
ncbi:uncharacterized protein RHO25_008987 [Cercospora beticola]|uniref:Uncharacterized protein n=1 Tax=Cercospora beticola TaxID=122368 RepID=A0ABZ0NXX7_CERBT|nr:hypothetical protein RHO25_008987 [Cercospora beticola]CAK1356839.1 unnamed protein product [Cercospora beticola]